MDSPDFNTPEDNQQQFARKQLSSAQTLTSICIIASPVSLVIGGMALGLVALICGLVALSKIRTAQAILGHDDYMAARLRHQAVLGIAISLISIILNLVSVVALMPYIIEYMQTGDFSQLQNALSGTQTLNQSSSSSVWD